VNGIFIIHQAGKKDKADFKARWGNRPNVDNWRRSASISGMALAKNDAKIAAAVADKNNHRPVNTLPQEITFDALYADLPLTPEAKKTSDSLITVSLFEAGITFIQEAEDCEEGTNNLERLRTLTPDFDKMNDVYFNLYYCYHKAGETAKAAAIKKLMSEQYPKDRYTQIVTTGKDPQSKSANSDATKSMKEFMTSS
jgi:hypothetical protein